jgi:hypothetical protein
MVLWFSLHDELGAPAEHAAAGGQPADIAEDMVEDPGAGPHHPGVGFLVGAVEADDHLAASPLHQGPGNALG